MVLEQQLLKHLKLLFDERVSSFLPKYLVGSSLISFGEGNFPPLSKAE